LLLKAKLKSFFLAQKGIALRSETLLKKASSSIDSLKTKAKSLTTQHRKISVENEDIDEVVEPIKNQQDFSNLKSRTSEHKASTPPFKR